MTKAEKALIDTCLSIEHEYDADDDPHDFLHEVLEATIEYKETITPKQLELPLSPGGRAVFGEQYEQE